MRNERSDRKDCRGCDMAAIFLCAGSTFQVEASRANGTLPYEIYTARVDVKQFGCQNKKVLEAINTAQSRLRANPQKP